MSSTKIARQTKFFWRTINVKRVNKTVTPSIEYSCRIRISSAMSVAGTANWPTTIPRTTTTKYNAREMSLDKRMDKRTCLEM